MRLIITLLLVCVFLLTSFFSKAQNGIFHKADSLLNAGVYSEASLQYDFVIYANSSSQEILVQGLLKKTACLKAQQKFDHIESLLNRIDMNKLNDSLKPVFYYEKALGNYLSENFEKAEQQILPVFNLASGDQNILLASTLLYCYILNEIGKWKEASVTLTQFLSGDSLLTSAEKEKYIKSVNEYYAEDNIPHLKSIRKARNLSLIFPGLGQAYNNDYLKGVESFSFVSLAGIYIGYNIINTTYFTAATAGAYLFLYFYYGGANQSGKLVPYKNYRKKYNYNNYLRTNLTILHKELSNNEQQKK